MSTHEEPPRGEPAHGEMSPSSSLLPPAAAAPGDVTRLLAEARAGDRSALDRVIPLVYEDLRRLARRQLAREHGARSVNPTTLVHEAYLKLAGNAPRAADRAHLLAIAAHAMRQVLVDQARARRAAKRGPGWASTTLTDGAWVATLDPEALLALDDALERLDPRQRQVVECRFFGGMDDAEIAEALGVTDRTVRRDWVKARAWLNRWLHDGSAPQEGGA
jgi:RNA polymerase sigma factor (TIGR02999 family)